MRRGHCGRSSACSPSDAKQGRSVSVRLRGTALLAALGLSVIAPTAPAESLPDRTAEHPVHFGDRPLQLEAIVGLGTKVGIAGLAVDYNFGDAFALGTGAGLGIHGPLWEVHARFRPVLGRLGVQKDLLSALSIESAFSRGQYADLPDYLGEISCEGDSSRVGDHCFHANTVPRLTSFAQLELGWELRFASGFGLRLSGGVASALHMATPQCINAQRQTVPCGGPEPQRTIVALTSAVGYAF